MCNAEWKMIGKDGTLYRAHYQADIARSHSLIIKLFENVFLVYSPGKDLIESAMKILKQDSEIILLAPSAAHITGVKYWKEHFENSYVVVSDTAKSRLLSKTSISEVNDLLSIESKLPPFVSLHILPDCKSGEVWLSIDIAGKIYWAVCDCFTNTLVLPSGIRGKFVSFLLRLKVGLRAHSIFRFNIKDKAVFRDWAVEQFSNGRENALIPCHGDIYDRDDFTDRIIEIIKNAY